MQMFWRPIYAGTARMRTPAEIWITLGNLRMILQTSSISIPAQGRRLFLPDTVRVAGWRSGFWLVAYGERVALAILFAPVLKYNAPNRAYSYRLTLSYAPRSDYLAEIAALPLFDLIVWQDDEFFIAEAFRPVLEPATDAGVYHMVQGRGHIDVSFTPETLQITMCHPEAGSL